MAIATLAQRLRACDEASMSECPFTTEQVILEAADALDAKDVELTCLREANKALEAEVAEHKRLKNQLVLKAYPAMDAIEEIAEGFRSAVHFVRNNAMNMERDYPEICHAEGVFNRARAALASLDTVSDPVGETARKCLEIAKNSKITLPLGVGLADGASIAADQICDALRTAFNLTGEAGHG